VYSADSLLWNCRRKVPKVSIWILILGTLPSVTLSEEQHVATIVGPYELSYSIERYSQRDPGVPAKGTYQFTESSGKFRASYEIGGSSLTFEYADGISVVIGRGSEAAIAEDGFAYFMLDLPIYMPFNFESAQVYYPLSKFIKQRDALGPSRYPHDLWSAYNSLGQSNISVALVPAASGGLTGPGTLTETPGATAEITSLTVGPPRTKYYDFTYTDYFKFRGVDVPKRIDLMVYTPVQEGSLEKSPKYLYRLRLLSCVANAKVVGPLNVEEIIPEGEMISYTGAGGRLAGVLFEPKAGPFLSQLRKQLAVRALVPKPRPRPQTCSPTIPLILCAGFGVLTLILLWVRPRRAEP
jgi:hypothetical protein